MNKRGTGVVFCLIAALLFSARYISAAIYMSNVSTWSRDLFQSSLKYVGTPLLTLSVISLLVGIWYLIREDLPNLMSMRGKENAEIQARIAKQKEAAEARKTEMKQEK